VTGRHVHPSFHMALGFKAIADIGKMSRKSGLNGKECP
jgi:hypothetical protein